MKDLTRTILLTAVFALFGCTQMHPAHQSGEETSVSGPYQATGFKIGEVSATDALIWTRLTRSATRVSDKQPMPIIRYRNPDTAELIEGPESLTPNVGNWESVCRYPPGTTIDTIEGAVPGAPGQVRVRFRPVNQRAWRSTEWTNVDTVRDFTRQVRLSALKPATHYEIVVEASTAENTAVSSSLEGRFRTAPLADDPASIVFAVSSCQEYRHQDAPEGGFKIYPAILELNPDFFVNTGDIVYYDRSAKNLELARWVWARMFSLPTNLAFHRQVGSYFIKADHETGLREYSTGAASDEHADGWSQEDVRPEHRYLNVVGGFLTVTTERSTGAPALILRHHDVDGNMLNEDRLVAN